MSEKKTVTVRIPVAVDRELKWVVGCCGSIWGDADAESETAEMGFNHLNCPSIVWITAEVPVPETTEVQGRVET